MRLLAINQNQSQLTPTEAADLAQLHDSIRANIRTALLPLKRSPGRPKGTNKVTLVDLKRAVRAAHKATGKRPTAWDVAGDLAIDPRTIGRLVRTAGYADFREWRRGLFPE